MPLTDGFTSRERVKKAEKPDPRLALALKFNPNHGTDGRFASGGMGSPSAHQMAQAAHILHGQGFRAAYAAAVGAKGKGIMGQFRAAYRAANAAAKAKKRIEGLAQKFNQNHDPEDGRFSSGGTGQAAHEAEMAEREKDAIAASLGPRKGNYVSTRQLMRQAGLDRGKG